MGLDLNDITATRRQEPDFDWYQATIAEDPLIVEAALLHRLYADSSEPSKGMNAYGAGFHLKRDGNTVAVLLYGGHNSGVNVTATGEDARALAAVVRELWPQHRVSRVDAAIDYDGAGVWDRIYEEVLDIANNTPDGKPRRRPLHLETQGDWVRENSEAGRTLYVGARSSAVRLRLYEKGKKHRAERLDGWERFSPDWVRAEVQLRPQKGAKSTAALLSASEMWGFSSWTRALYERLQDEEVSRTQMHEWRAPDDERAWKALLRQYGPLLRRRVDTFGGWEGLGARLGVALEDAGQPDDWRPSFDARAASRRAGEAHA